MPMIAFKSDREKTKQRFSRLMRYFSKEIFDEQKHRDCQFYKKSCRPSHPASFFYGKLDHVGNHYDLFRGRQPLRIAVVAQDDNGQTEFKSFHERSGEVRGSGARPFSPSTQDFSGERARSRNPHMRGTTNLLRLIFEIDLGCDYHSEFLRINGQSIHFFDAFALLNASLCTAASEKGSAKPYDDNASKLFESLGESSSHSGTDSRYSAGWTSRRWPSMFRLWFCRKVIN
jgi:hypothetical protein